MSKLSSFFNLLLTAEIIFFLSSKIGEIVKISIKKAKKTKVNFISFFATTLTILNISVYGGRKEQ